MIGLYIAAILQIGYKQGYWARNDPPAPGSVRGSDGVPTTLKPYRGYVLWLPNKFRVDGQPRNMRLFGVAYNPRTGVSLGFNRKRSKAAFFFREK